MKNSADSDLQKPTDLDLHTVCKGKVNPGSAGQGLMTTLVGHFLSSPREREKI